MNKGIRKVFSKVPHTYELVNHTLTLFLDIFWRKKAAQIAAQSCGNRWIDMCSGTGEMAVNLRRLARKETRVFASDFSYPMLSRAVTKPNGEQITFVLSDMMTLPFADNTFDCITISFATRNLNVNREDLLTCYREFYRIVKPGGCFVTLETSQPSSAIIRTLFHLYVKLLVQPVGTFISGYKPGYSMLSGTIRKFYPAEQLADLMKTAGFNEVGFQKLLFGVAAIHRAIKR